MALLPAGKSAALIMRKIQPEAMAEALQLAVKEAGEWLAALALKEGATPPSLLAKMRADAALRCASHCKLAFVTFLACFVRQ